VLVKIELSSMTKVEVMQNFRKSRISYKDEATIENCKKFPVDGKNWHPVI